MMRHTCLVLALLAMSAGGDSRGETPATKPNWKVLLEPEGIDLVQSQSIVHTLQSAAGVYVRDFGFDVPSPIFCSVTAKVGLQSRLWTDGTDHIFQQLPSKQALAQPSQTGIYHLYGLCHELGHICMYRLLQDHDWLSGGALEGWAHYTGSEVVDRVYEEQGEKLWWQPYDYRADGTRRLDRQLARQDADSVVKGAGEWRKLEKIIGKKGFAPVFRAWQKAGIDPYHPEAALPVLQKACPGHDQELADWWTAAAPVLLEPCKASDFAKQEIAPSKLAGQLKLLRQDDGTSDGRWAYNDVGHGRTFDAPEGGPWYLKAVSVYGARYGSNPAPDRNFEVVLCDEAYRPIAHWKGKYAQFPRGQSQWARFPTTPTRVPERFGVLVIFRTSSTQGVYVFFDNSTSGHSVTGLPGKETQAFDKGDWMIRVELDRAAQ